MKTLGKTLSRLSQMSWEERRTRLVQEAGKRIDLALYRVGLLPHQNGLSSAALPSGKFFFSHADLPQLASLLKARLGTEVETILREADDICCHRFRLLGYDNLDYGPEIDWHLDAVHGKRAPMRPWFKIDFLNFDEVGDHKVIWELNRHQHLVTLAKAWLLTNDGRYAKEAQKQWYSWQKANPYPIGINWASSLEVAFRSLSWLWMLQLLPDFEPAETTFHPDVIRSLAMNARYIERNLSTYFSPNTHLLGEATALFFIGTMCPEIDGAYRFRESGWRILVHEAQRQVRSDGVYFEQSLYYHVYALDFFLHARALATINNIAIPPEFDRTLNKMLDLLCAISQAGPAEGFGDDDGGRLSNPRRNRTEHMTDPLALGAILFQREDLKPAVSLTEEAIWLFGEGGVSFFDKSPNTDRTIEPTCFPEGGVYVMSSQQPIPQEMVIDAGPHGAARGGHGHADALSVRVTADGRRWLVDPGSFCYVCNHRNHFRGTGAHNTLQVDELDQGVPDGPFAWSSIPEVRCEKWTEGETFTYFAGSHSGYMRLADPVRHRRCIFHLHGEFWLIRDLAEGAETHNLVIPWHFASNIAVSKIQNGFVALPKDAQSDDNGEAARLVLLTPEGAGWNSALETDSVSSAYGEKQSAPVVRLNTCIRLPAEHGTLLLPLPSSGQVGKFSQPGVTQTDGPSTYCYDEVGKTHYMMFADSQSAGATVPTHTATDAGFLYFAVQSGRITRFILCDGSAATINGESVIAHSRKIERFEWDRKTGGICSSDSTAAPSFSEKALGSFTL